MLDIASRVHGLLSGEEFLDNGVGFVSFHELGLLLGQGVETKAGTLVDIMSKPLHV